MVVAFNNAVPTEPVGALVPDQAPEAVQAVAFLAAQESVEAEPLVTVLGVADSDTMGAAEPTETVTDCAALPPPTPLHVMM